MSNTRSGGSERLPIDDLVRNMDGAYQSASQSFFAERGYWPTLALLHSDTVAQGAVRNFRPDVCIVEREILQGSVRWCATNRTYLGDQLKVLSRDSRIGGIALHLPIPLSNRNSDVTYNYPDRRIIRCMEPAKDVQGLWPVSEKTGDESEKARKTRAIPNEYPVPHAAAVMRIIASQQHVPWGDAGRRPYVAAIGRKYSLTGARLAQSLERCADAGQCEYGVYDVPEYSPGVKQTAQRKIAALLERADIVVVGRAAHKVWPTSRNRLREDMFVVDMGLSAGETIGELWNRRGTIGSSFAGKPTGFAYVTPFDVVRVAARELWHGVLAGYGTDYAVQSPPYPESC